MKFRKVVFCLFWVASFGCLSFGLAHAAGFSKGPYLLLPPSNTEFSIIWQADDTPQKSYVEWGVSDQYGNQSPFLSESGNGINEHQFQYTISGLLPASRYYYRVTIDSTSVSGSFYTAPQSVFDSVVFYSFGDTRSFPAMHNTVAGSVLDDIGSDAVQRQSFVLHTGDYVSNGELEFDWLNEYFKRSYSNIVKLLAQVPVIGCRGNHEGDARLLEKYWPNNISLGKYFYSFDYGPVHVSIVDQYIPYDKGSEQYIWLENDLQQAVGTWKIVMLHQPPWSAGGHLNDVNTQKILGPLFERAGVSIVLAGHNHYYARCKVKGIQYVTSGGGGGPLYEPDPTFPYVVASAKSHHYIRYEISSEALVAFVYDYSGVLLDKFKIRKGLDWSIFYPAILGEGKVLEQ